MWVLDNNLQIIYYIIGIVYIVSILKVQDVLIF